MGIKITPAGKAIPGYNGIPGNVYNNKELFKSLHPYANFGSYFSPGLNRKIQKQLELFERATGIEQRGLLIDEKKKLPYPTERLGIHAGIDGFNNINKIKEANGERPLRPSDVEGFIFVSNTQERVFTPGREICNLLGINPQYHSFVSGLSCSGFVKALREAGTLFASERYKDINTVVIIVSELTSKLRQKDGDNLQSFLFGDGAVMFLIERSDKGGIQIWGPNIDLGSPDVLHFSSYSGEEKEIKEKHKELSMGNDKRLKDFAYYELNRMPKLFQLFMNHSISRTAEHQSVIFPQIARKVHNKTLDHFKETVPLPVTVVSSTLPLHANTGAVATPLAWFQGVRNNEISPDRIVTTFNCGFSGTQAITTYDPNAEKTFSHYDTENDGIHLDIGFEPTSDRGRKATELNPTSEQNTIVENGNSDASLRLRDKMNIS